MAVHTKAKNITKTHLQILNDLETKAPQAFWSKEMSAPAVPGEEDVGMKSTCLDFPVG